MDNSCILVISDLQAPFNHIDAIAFLSEVKKQFKPTRIINIGDLADFHGLNFHGVNPNLPSAKDELILLKGFVGKLAKLFPIMTIVDSNHDALPIRKARSVGIPDDMIKDIGSLIGAPAGWIFKKQITTILPNGIKCRFKHNYGSNLLMDSIKQGMSLVCGHLHSKSNISFWQNDNGINFSMQVGCLINDKHPAFDYNKNQSTRPVLTVSIIKNGVPILLPMYLDNKKRWKEFL